MTVFALVFSIVMAVSSLAWGYVTMGLVQPARWLLILGAIWLLAQWRRWMWFSTLGLFVTVSFAAFGLWIGLPFGWMFAGALGGLLAWDLSDFSKRLRLAAEDDDRSGLERRHLARLTIVTLASIGLASISMAVRLQFTFEWALLLALVAALGLTQLVAWLRSRE